MVQEHCEKEEFCEDFDVEGGLVETPEGEIRTDKDGREVILSDRQEREEIALQYQSVLQSECGSSWNGAVADATVALASSSGNRGTTASQTTINVNKSDTSVDHAVALAPSSGSCKADNQCREVASMAVASASSDGHGCVSTVCHADAVADAIKRRQGSLQDMLLQSENAEKVAAQAQDYGKAELMLLQSKQLRDDLLQLERSVRTLAQLRLEAQHATDRKQYAAATTTRARIRELEHSLQMEAEAWLIDPKVTAASAAAQTNALQRERLRLQVQLSQAIKDENVIKADKIKEVLQLLELFMTATDQNDPQKAWIYLRDLRRAQRRLQNDKPLVNAPELGDRIKDTQKEPYWIPGIFPTIFQNETGDPFNYYMKEPDLQLWGPHVMMSKGWVAQEHPTFMYWWLNTIQRRNAMAAKKWFIRENPNSVAWTVEELLKMSKESLGKRLVGYTAKIPGTKASKNVLRRVLLTMVWQLEVETTSQKPTTTDHGEKAGEVPCVFGTLTSQRYHWDQPITVIAKVVIEREGLMPKTVPQEQQEAWIKDWVNSLSQNKRRELVNKYPLFVAWYAALRLELVLKTVVVPIFQAHAYAAVFEWSPTGAMVHLHYILWKSGAPRFDQRAQDIIQQAKALQKAGLVAAAEVQCSVDDVLSYFNEYINEWNPNKDSKGDDLPSSASQSEDKHPASLEIDQLIQLLKSENAEARFKYYQRAVMKEQLHNFHYPDPNGPPASAQSCATLMKGTSNIWYCKSGYPRELVCEVCHENIAQDAIRPELWRVNMCRNCPLMNPHSPLVTVAMQSNTDACPVVTCEQCEKYLCKYCSKHLKGVGQKSALYDVIDDMKEADQRSWDKDPRTYQASIFGSKMHKTFMAEVGEEMSQAELAHHANGSPEYLISRPIKHVYLYKKAHAINLNKSKQAPDYDWDPEWDEWQDWDAEWDEFEDDHEDAPRTQNEAAQTKTSKPHKRKSNRQKPSDVDLYESRHCYKFAEHTPCSCILQHVCGMCDRGDDCYNNPCDTAVEQRWSDDQAVVPDTPEWQVCDMSLFQFFHLVKFVGGRKPRLQWHAHKEWPIVVMSPQIKLMEGPDFPFAARWCLMQYHTWNDRRHFIDKSDAQIDEYFRKWINHTDCPWYVVQLYLKANGKTARLGAGRLTDAKKRQQQFDEENVARDEVQLGLSHDDEEQEEQCEQTAEDAEQVRLYKALRDGNLREINISEAVQRKCVMHSAKHDYYKNTRCTSIAQEEQSATPVGVINVCVDDEDEDGDYIDQCLCVHLHLLGVVVLVQWDSCGCQNVIYALVVAIIAVVVVGVHKYICSW